MKKINFDFIKKLTLQIKNKKYRALKNERSLPFKNSFAKGGPINIGD